MATTAQSINFLLAGIQGAELGSMEFYETGTTTPKSVYTDQDLGGATTSITLDANGAVAGSTVYFGTGFYRVVVKDVSSVTLYTKDGINFGSDISADASGYADLSDAVAAIGATEIDLIIGAALNVGDANDNEAVTVPATMRLVFQRGGSLVFAGTETATIDGPISAGTWQIFDSAASGKVILGNLVAETLPEWWGITGTGDEVAINKAIVAAGSYGKVILTPSSSYSTSNPINIASAFDNAGLRGFTFDGNLALITSTSATDMLTWGNNTRTVHCALKNIRLNTANGGSPVGIRFTGVGSQLNQFSHLYVQSDGAPQSNSMGIVMLADGLGNYWNKWDNIYPAGFDIGVSIGYDFGTSSASTAEVNRQYFYGVYPQVYNKYGIYYSKGAGSIIDAFEFSSASAIAIGDATTRYDVTDEGGNTFRYTYDGTGTDPGITATTIETKQSVLTTGFNAANNDKFRVTGSGANYFEVTNASGVAESDITAVTVSVGSIADLYIDSTGGSLQARGTAESGSLYSLEIESGTESNVIQIAPHINTTQGTTRRGTILDNNTSTNKNLIITQDSNTTLSLNTLNATAITATESSTLTLTDRGDGQIFMGSKTLIIGGVTAANAVVLAQKIRTLANDATPDVDTGNHFLTGGTTAITDFDAGIEGQTITVIAEHTLTITDGTNIFLSGSANWSMTATDTLTLIQKADGKWYELSRGDNGA